MSSPQEVCAKVWGGKPKDYRIIDEETLVEEFERGYKKGALDEVLLLEVFNAKNFIDKPYVLIRKYCEKE